MHRGLNQKLSVFTGETNVWGFSEALLECADLSAAFICRDLSRRTREERQAKAWTPYACHARWSFDPCRCI